MRALAFAALGAEALASLMDFETELGFYMVSFILICFRLPRLKITASLWQTNAPGAKISRLAPAIAQPSSGQVLGRFGKKSFHRRRQSRNRASHTAIHQPSTPHRLHPRHTYTHRSSCRFDREGKEGLMELYGSGQSCQYIERFTTLLSKGLVCLSLRSTEARGCVMVL